MTKKRPKSLNNQLEICIFARKFRNKYDSLYSRETERSPGYSKDIGGQQLARRIYGGQWLSGDVDIRPPVHTEGTRRLHPGVETLGADAVAHDSAPFRHKADKRQGYREAIQDNRGPDAEGRQHSELW